MADDIVRADDEVLPYAEMEKDEFERAHVRWLRARASLSDPDSPGDDESYRQRIRENGEAARALLLLPVPQGCHDLLWAKLDALTAELETEARDGACRFSVVVAGLGAIKQDLINLEICC